MIAMIIERVPASLRGELTRWLLEPRAGVFVGEVSALVRDKLWELVEDKAQGGDGILIHSSDTGQGFAVRSFGVPDRDVVDFDGLSLFRLRRQRS
jgi:CRISPR-associated protein Cas2